MPFPIQIITNLNPGSRNLNIYSFSFTNTPFLLTPTHFSLKLYLKINQMTCSQSPSLIKSTIYLSDLMWKEKWEFGRESHLMIIHFQVFLLCCLFSFLALIHIYPHSILHLLSLEMNVGLIIDWHLEKPRRQISDCHSAHKLEVTKGQIFPNMSESMKK